MQMCTVLVTALILLSTEMWAVYTMLGGVCTDTNNRCPHDSYSLPFQESATSTGGSKISQGFDPLSQLPPLHFASRVDSTI